MEKRKNFIKNFSDAMIREYSALLNHISASFDNYRAELSALLYPVFTHFYIQQILEGHSLSGIYFFIHSPNAKIFETYN